MKRKQPVVKREIETDISRRVQNTQGVWGGGGKSFELQKSLKIKYKRSYPTENVSIMPQFSKQWLLLLLKFFLEVGQGPWTCKMYLVVAMPSKIVKRGGWCNSFKKADFFIYSCMYMNKYISRLPTFVIENVYV